MVEGKFYCRYEGENSQRQTHLGESRVDMTLSHVRRGGKKGKRGQPGAAARRPKVQKEQKGRGGEPRRLPGYHIPS